MKASVRPMAGTELEDKVSQLRIVAYPAFPEVREVDYYAALYRWYETHPLVDEIHRWVAATEE